MALIFRGGGFLSPAAFPCPGSVVSLTLPDNMVNAVWIKGSAIGAVFDHNQTDPFGVSNNAGQLDSNANNSNAFVYQLVSLSASTIYEISGYFKNTVAPSWLNMQFTDFVANDFGAYFNFATGVVGNTFASGGGTTSCAQIQGAGNGFYQFSLAGSSTAWSGSSGGPRFFFSMVSAGDGSNDNAQNGQEFFYYNIGP